MDDNLTWDSVFTEVGRRKINGGPKTTASDEMTWRGMMNGREVFAVSRVRLINPMESFQTSSGHRLRDSRVGDEGHYVDLRVETTVTQEELDRIHAMAVAHSRLRPVVTTQGKHAPARQSRWETA